LDGAVLIPLDATTTLAWVKIRHWQQYCLGTLGIQHYRLQQHCCWVSVSIQGTTAYWNSSLGYQALYSNITGGQNVAMGYQSAYATDNGNNVVAIGYQALTANTSGSSNAAVGAQSLNTGSANTPQALLLQHRPQTTTGWVAVGNQAGTNVNTGQQNVLLVLKLFTQVNRSYCYNRLFKYNWEIGAASALQAQHHPCILQHWWGIRLDTIRIRNNWNSCAYFYTTGKLST
jgi:hypothetical protein